MIPLYDTARTRLFPLVTWLLVAANALAFVFELSLGPGALEGFIRTWGLVPAQLFGRPQVEWVTVLHIHVPARRLVAHPEQHVGAVDLR